MEHDYAHAPEDIFGNSELAEVSTREDHSGIGSSQQESLLAAQKLHWVFGT